MAEYAARIVELDKEVATLREQALQVEHGGGPAAVLATYIRLTAGIATYGETRDRALEEGLGHLEADSSATAESQQQRWTSHYQARGSGAFRAINDLASRDDDSIRRVFEILAMQESMAFTAIAAMPLAGAVGQIRAHLRTLEEQTQSLQGHWSELTAQDERLDGQIAGLRVQVLEDFKRSVSEVRGWGPKIEEAVRKGVEAWAGYEGVTPDPPLNEPVKAGLAMLASLQRTLDEATRQTLPLYSAEQTVHELFGKIRLQIKEYLEKVNKDSVARMYSDACRATQDAADKCPKDGQKQDARKLAEKAISASQKIMGEFNSTWDRFYSEFEGRFTGDVSAQTVELLAEQEFFNQFWRDVESLNLPGEIRNAGDAIAKCESITLDRLTDDQRRQWKEAVHARLAELQDRIRSMDMSVWERFRLQFITTPREQIREKLSRLPGFRK